jgi:hypothetical protein
VNQPLDNRENQRGRDTEHQQSGGCFDRSQQLPSWRQYDVAGTYGRVVTSRTVQGQPEIGDRTTSIEQDAQRATSRICPASESSVVPPTNVKFSDSRTPSRPLSRSRRISMMMVCTTRPWMTIVPKVAESPTSKELTMAIRFESVISPAAPPRSAICASSLLTRKFDRTVAVISENRDHVGPSPETRIRYGHSRTVRRHGGNRQGRVADHPYARPSSISLQWLRSRRGRRALTPRPAPSIAPDTGP